MVISANLGMSRIGAHRELKKAVESFWKGEINEAQLKEEAAKIRATNWKMQKEAGIGLIPSNDFSFYDQVLDTIAMVGAIPARYGFKGGNVDMATYFSMGRGRHGSGTSVPAMEMTKWFDTNYHYIVPELSQDMNFKLSTTKAVDEFSEADKQGVRTKPVLVGPITFLLLGKMKDGKGSALDLLPKLLPVYKEVISHLASAGAEWIQIDEPILVTDISHEAKAAFPKVYAELSKAAGATKILLATYFEDMKENLETALNLPVAAVHLDLVRAPQQLDKALEAAPKSLTLSLGVVDGRNIWKNNLEESLAVLEKAAAKIGRERIIVAPSCSLLHTPVDLDNEKKLDAELKNWLAFAKQKMKETSVLARALNDKSSVKNELEENKKVLETRKTSKRIHNDDVKKRMAAVNDSMLSRKNVFGKRADAQRQSLGLPLLPTTTIGSFPQTQEVRVKRADLKKGKINEVEYNKFIKQEIEKTVRYQEKVGIDVLVHGEFERNDMVEYFGEQLAGFAFTENGWVQSYGSRGVKPPIIFGDVFRKAPMTVDWTKYAQSLTQKLMKGMLTGPVTILQWSFVRDDQARETTCKQIGLAIRDEVQDLEKAGIKVIQIDEPAFREGLPLRKSDWAKYLKWAVDSFRLSSTGVADETQIHTHMCYSEFNDIIKAIADLDADVISIETSRSQMELLEAFVNYKYPNEIGPGVYDIHSPRTPTVEEMEKLLKKALDVLSPEQIWVNPDCGLKTRAWKDVEPALQGMVDAAKALREELKSSARKQAAN